MIPQNRALPIVRGASGDTVDTSARFAQLYQQVGRVRLDADTPADELDRFHRAIARAYAANPDLRITGNRLAHEGSDAIVDPDHAVRSPTGSRTPWRHRQQRPIRSRRR